MLFLPDPEARRSYPPNRLRTFSSLTAWRIKTGRVLGVIGEAGSGKTVLARAIVRGLNEPLTQQAGQVFYQGDDISSLPPQRLAEIRGNKIGYIGSNPAGALDPTIPVGEQIVEKLLSVSPGLSRSAAREWVLEVLVAVRIPSPDVRFHEYPFQFSGGMMQRVMIVDALVTNPSVLIADNITQALDVTVAAQIIRLIQELRDRFSTAILFISSSLPVVETIADEVLVLQQGRIIEQATPSALINAPQHDYTKSLLARLPRIWGADISGPAASDAPALMSVEDVHRTYMVRKKGTFRGMNAVRAVRGVTLDIREGENIGIVGESGCGKSTLTRLLAWLEAPEQGTIRFAGEDLSQLSRQDLTKLRQSFQLLLQDPYSSLPSRMAVGRIIAEPLLIHGHTAKSEIRSRVLEAMNEVGLDQALENQLTVGLSAGQRQRINIERGAAYCVELFSDLDILLTPVMPVVNFPAEDRGIDRECLCATPPSPRRSTSPEIRRFRCVAGLTSVGFPLGFNSSGNASMMHGC